MLSRPRWTSAALLALLALSVPARAQDTPKKDDAVEKLLKELDTPPADTPPADSKAPKPDARPADKKAGEVDTKDAALDDLLGKLGETPDEPAPQGKAPKPGKPDPADKDKDKDKGGEGKSPEKGDGLKAGDKPIDKRLEELTGRRTKKDEQEQEGGGQGQGGGGGGPLDQVVKRMREVERRLSQPDTGEATREEQKKIVKDLDTLIEQMKSSQGQGQGPPKLKKVQAGGKQPGGQKPGQNQGALAKGAPPSKPASPNAPPSAARNKDMWGHLSPQERAEMENSFKEEMLEKRRELIEKYYTAVNKKALSRED